MAFTDVPIFQADWLNQNPLELHGSRNLLSSLLGRLVQEDTAMQATRMGCLSSFVEYGCTKISIFIYPSGHESYFSRDHSGVRLLRRCVFDRM